jgi:hypothetical protein
MIDGGGVCRGICQAPCSQVWMRGARVAQLHTAAQLSPRRDHQPGIHSKRFDLQLHNVLSHVISRMIGMLPPLDPNPHPTNSPDIQFQQRKHVFWTKQANIIALVVEDQLPRRFE